MASRTRARNAARLAPALAAALALGSGAAWAGELRGRLEPGLPGVRLADVGPIVVYLELPSGAAPAAAAPPPVALRQRDAAFSPRFLAVARAQTVAMPNDDSIYHNVFSFSAPNDFDLGLYPAGESRSIAFRHPGVVRLYCSIHESMNGTIFVAPTPWFAVTDAQGRFAIQGIPPGRWRLRTWTEKLPGLSRTLEIGAGTTQLELSLAEAAGR